MAQNTVTVFPSVISDLEVLINSVWERVPFTGDVEASASPAPVQEVVTSRGVGAVAGKPRLPSYSVALPSFAPHLGVMQSIETMRMDRVIANWRWGTPGETFAATNATALAAVATDGSVTFSGSGHEIDFADNAYGPGLVVNIGGERFTVNAVDENGAVTVVDAPSVAVSAAAYAVELPGLRQTFRAQVISSPAFAWSGGADAQLTSSLQLQPVSEPVWTMVNP